MGKRSRARASTRLTPPAENAAVQLLRDVKRNHPIIDAVSAFVIAADKLAQAAERQRVDLQCVRLPNQLEQLIQYVRDGEAHDDLEDLLIGWCAVEQAVPVAAARPHHRPSAGDTGRRWVGPLTGGEIRDLTEIADPTDPGYREQMRANAEYHARLEALAHEQRSATCGRPTATGRPCAATPIYMPPRGYLSGYPCRRHVSDETSATVAAFYARAVAEHDCPGCPAKAGRACSVGQGSAATLRLVDGEWPKERHWAEHHLHDARLNLMDPPPEAAAPGL